MPLVQALEHVASLKSPGGASGHAWMSALLDLVFPALCPVCERRLGAGRRDPLCGACWAALERIASPCCRVCGLPFGQLAPVEPAGKETAEHLCGRCRRQPPPYDHARSAARYAGVAREAVHAFKFGGRRAMAAPLGDLLVEAMACLPPRSPDLIVPVPLHARRARERGFNQSGLLARRLGQSLRCPVRADLLVRTAHTPPQTELSGEARRLNVRKAFAVRCPSALEGRHVILVDDVFTTGSTAAACARSLKRAGALSVVVLTVARAV